tara:strand:- start:83 stop:463 length:381 start_codon:yes stop_codon:yes gene_type:complete
LNYEFSNPLKTNELFRPILQLLALRGTLEYKFLIRSISNYIMSSYKEMKMNTVQSVNIDNIIFQVELNLDEAIEYLVFNNIINVKKSSNDEIFELTEIGRLHIQSEEPIKFYDHERNLRYILDFLP